MRPEYIIVYADIPLNSLKSSDPAHVNKPYLPPTDVAKHLRKVQDQLVHQNIKMITMTGRRPGLDGSPHKDLKDAFLAEGVTFFRGERSGETVHSFTTPKKVHVDLDGLRKPLEGVIRQFQTPNGNNNNQGFNRRRGINRRELIRGIRRLRRQQSLAEDNSSPVL